MKNPIRILFILLSVSMYHPCMFSQSSFDEQLFKETAKEIFLQGIFGNKYARSKDLVKKHTGDIFIRQPNDYKAILDFDISKADEKREEKLEDLFSEFIVPFANKALSRIGLRELAEQGKICLLPAVKEELV